VADQLTRQTWPSSQAQIVRDFVNQILHGDDEHKAWLIRAGEQYIYAGKVVTRDDRAD
jgi:hypothetical protein